MTRKLLVLLGCLVLTGPALAGPCPADGAATAACPTYSHPTFIQGGATMGPASSAPSSPVVGQTYWDTSLTKLRTWNGASWSSAGTPSGTSGQVQTNNGSGGFFALTEAQLTSIINIFTSTLQGVVPPSGGGITNFLRADGNWATAGAPPGGSSGQVQTNNGSGAFNGLTNAQLTADISTFTPTFSGAVPGSGGGSLNFLRADGIWAPPPSGGGGSPGGSSGNVQANNGTGGFAGLTNTQLTADINLFTTSLAGATPSSGGGTTNYLRADGTWAAPPGTGSGITWPANGDVVIANGTSSPAGVAPSGTNCLVSSGGSWTTGSCGGGGGIAGPGSSTVGFIPQWSNTGGTALGAGVSLTALGSIGMSASAGAASGVFTNTQMNTPFKTLTNGLDPLTFYQISHSGHFATLGLVSGITVPNTSTVYEADAIAGYISTASVATPAVAGSFYALNKVAGGLSFGLNPLVDDQGNSSTVMGAEFDIGSSNILSSAYGINMIGVFPSGTPNVAVAYQASILNSPWQYVLVSYDGTSAGYAFVGSIGTGANSDGQTFTFNTRDSTNTVRQCLLQALHQTSTAEMYSSCPLVVGSNILITGGAVVQALATTCSGAPSGTLWNNGGVMNICP